MQCSFEEVLQLDISVSTLTYQNKPLLATEHRTEHKHAKEALCYPSSPSTEGMNGDTFRDTARIFLGPTSPTAFLPFEGHFL